MERWSVDSVSGRMDRGNGFEDTSVTLGLRVCMCVYVAAQIACAWGAARGFVCCRCCLFLLWLLDHRYYYRPVCPVLCSSAARRFVVAMYFTQADKDDTHGQASYG